MDVEVAVVEEAGEREKHCPEAMRKDKVKKLGVSLRAEAGVMGYVSFRVGVGFRIGQTAEILGQEACNAAHRAGAGEDEVVCGAFMK